MKLTTTEKYALAVLEVNPKLSELQKEKQSVCLVASCIWDMIEAETIAPDAKGRLKISEPLPESLSYCDSIYELLAKKSKKPEDVVLEYTHTLTGRRIKTLTESIVDSLLNKSVLTVEKQDSLLNAKLYHVNNLALAEDIAAIRNMENETITSNQFLLAILLLKSGIAKKILNRDELSNLKKAAKQDRGNFQPYVKNMIAMAETTISSSIATFIVTQ